jgi:hypothetical protein
MTWRTILSGVVSATRGDALIEIGHLMAAPDLDLVAVLAGDGIERLHRGMGEVGELELRRDHLGRGFHRRSGIAVMARHGRRAAGRELSYTRP